MHLLVASLVALKINKFNRKQMFGLLFQRNGNNVFMFSVTDQTGSPIRLLSFSTCSIIMHTGKLPENGYIYLCKMESHL